MSLFFDEIRDGEEFRFDGEEEVYVKTGLLEYEDSRGILFAFPSLTLPHNKLSPVHTRVRRVE